MHFRNLGNSGIKVSTVSLGGWINFENKIPEDEAKRIVSMAYDSGINFFDLADVYGYGEAERWMGGMLSEFPRQTLVISSKVFWPMSDDVNNRGLSRKHIMESIDKSLQRLGTDYLDIYFCHRADPETPLLETARAMDDLIRQGKVLYWGTSEWEPHLVEEVSELCGKYNLYPPQVEQPEYSMLYRERVENQLLPVTQPRGIGIVAFSPLKMGLLTGKYDNGIPEGSRFDTEEWSKEGRFTEENIQKVKRLKPVADDLEITRAQLALAWVLRREDISSVITGATKVSQVEDNVAAAEVELSDEVINEIENTLA